MKKLAKIARMVFNYTTRNVTDAETLKPEIAIYYRIFGIVVKTTYKTI